MKAAVNKLIIRKGCQGLQPLEALPDHLNRVSGGHGKAWGIQLPGSGHRSCTGCRSSDVLTPLLSGRGRPSSET